MHNRQIDTRPETKPSVLRQAVERQAEQAGAQEIVSAQRDPLAQVTCRIGDTSCANTHASTLNRATASRPIRGVQSLLKLQRQYGNRYVQRVLALARNGGGKAGVSPEVEQSIQRMRGGGRALDNRVRAQMEPAFGADFGGVRVHTDARADTLNRELGAHAFTTGQDILFRQGAYNPGSSSGLELLAHELTHVVQQNGDEVRPKLTISQPGDRYEQEADRLARAIVHQEQHLIQKETEQGSVQRQAEEEEEETSQTDKIPGMGGKGLHSITNAIIADRPARIASGISRISHSIIQRQRAVRWGSIGCPVPRAQGELNVTGTGLVVDGRFGPLTNAAVRNFQGAHPPLAVDGVIGTNTWPVLHGTAPGNHGLPIGEITNPNGWGTGNSATLHRWQQLLNPATTSFRRCQVAEADPGGGTDTCHFPGSVYAPFNAITGGTWRVNARNRWGDDWVGWFTHAVTYYRNQGRAPCSASFPQSMRVVRPDGNVEYARHQLVATIGTTTVSSTRAGQTATRAWP